MKHLRTFVLLGLPCVGLVGAVSLASAGPSVGAIQSISSAPWTCGGNPILLVTVGGETSKGRLLWSGSGSTPINASLNYTFEGGPPRELRLDSLGAKLDCSLPPPPSVLVREVSSPGAPKPTIVERWTLSPGQVAYTPQKVTSDDAALALQSLFYDCGGALKVTGKVSGGVLGGGRQITLREEWDTPTDTSISVTTTPNSSADFVLTSTRTADCAKKPPRVTLTIHRPLLPSEVWRAQTPSHFSFNSSRK